MTMETKDRPPTRLGSSVVKPLSILALTFCVLFIGARFFADSGDKESGLVGPEISAVEPEGSGRGVLENAIELVTEGRTHGSLVRQSTVDVAGRFRLVVLDPEGSPVGGARVQVESVISSTADTGAAWFEREALLDAADGPYLEVVAQKGKLIGSAIAPIGAESVVVRLGPAPIPPVKGVVVEQESGKPLLDVTLRSGALVASPDHQGRFVFPGTQFRLTELSVIRGGKVIHHQKIPFGQEHRIEVPRAGQATLRFSPAGIYDGTVTVYGKFESERIQFGEPQSFNASGHVELTGLPIRAKQLTARIQCRGYVGLEVGFAVGAESHVQLEATETLTVLAAPPPPGHTIEVTVGIRNSNPAPKMLAPKLDQYSKNKKSKANGVKVHGPIQSRPIWVEKAVLSPRGEAKFQSLPAGGTAVVYLDAVARVGYGRIRILSQNVALRKRVIDVSEVAMFATRFECAAPDILQPFQLDLEFSDSYCPDVKVPWFGWGHTSSGVAKSASFRSSVFGIVEVALPRSEQSARAFSGTRILGTSKTRIDAESTIVLSRQDRVKVEFEIFSKGQPAPGRRIKLSPPETGRASDTLCSETLTYLSDARGKVSAELYPQEYCYRVEGLYGVVDGLKGHVKASDSISVEFHLREPSRIHINSPYAEPVYVAIYLSVNGGLYTATDGGFYDLVTSRYFSGDKTIQLEAGRYTIYIDGKNRNSKSVEVELEPGEETIIAL